jgi:LysM repeat protein
MKITTQRQEGVHNMTQTRNKLTIPQKLAISGAVGALGVSALTGLNTSVHAAGEGETYVIQAGDTMASIATNYGSTVEALAAENGIADPDLIYAGDTLYLPGEGIATSVQTTVTPTEEAPAPEAPAPTTEPVAQTTEAAPAAPQQPEVVTQPEEQAAPQPQAPTEAVAQPVAAPTQPQAAPVSGGSYEDMIRAEFGPDADHALNIAMCESTMNPNAYNGVLGAAGLFQIIPSTFASTSVGQSGASVYDPQANIKAAHEIVQRDGGSWAQWECR